MTRAEVIQADDIAYEADIFSFHRLPDRKQVKVLSAANAGLNYSDRQQDTLLLGFVVGLTTAPAVAARIWSSTLYRCRASSEAAGFKNEDLGCFVGSEPA